MRIKQHAESGLWVSDAGMVCMPPVKGRGGTHSRTFYWTYGWLKPDGYRMVTWQKKRYHVHRMVLETFGPPSPPDKRLVDHINRIRDDNRIANLRWADYSENGFNCKKADNAQERLGGYSDTKERYHKYYLAHKDMFRAYSKRYADKNRKAINASQREKYAADPDRRSKQKMASKAWCVKNKERHKKYLHDYYLAKKQGLACV